MNEGVLEADRPMSLSKARRAISDALLHNGAARTTSFGIAPANHAYLYGFGKEGRWLIEPEQFARAVDELLPRSPRIVWRSQTAAHIRVGAATLALQGNFGRTSLSFPQGDGRRLLLIGPRFHTELFPEFGVPTIEAWRRLAVAQPSSGFIGDRLRWGCPECTKCFTARSSAVRHLRNGSCWIQRARAKERLGINPFFDENHDTDPCQVEVEDDDRARLLGET